MVFSKVRPSARRFITKRGLRPIEIIERKINDVAISRIGIAKPVDKPGGNICEFV
jgi:hypothetical protein